jgi:FtsZ-interacting cell division protein ZipA
MFPDQQKQKEVKYYETAGYCDAPRVVCRSRLNQRSTRQKAGEESYQDRDDEEESDPPQEEHEDGDEEVHHDSREERNETGEDTRDEVEDFSEETHHEETRHEIEDRNEEKRGKEKEVIILLLVPQSYKSAAGGLFYSEK